jgi:hypothetical protein
VDAWCALRQNQFRNHQSPGSTEESLINVCSAALDETHSSVHGFDCDRGDDHPRLTGYGYSCIGIDTRGNEKPIRQCALLLVAFTVWAEPALARNHLNCVSKKVIIGDAPSGTSSLSAEENIGTAATNPST